MHLLLLCCCCCCSYILCYSTLPHNNILFVVVFYISSRSDPNERFYSSLLGRNSEEHAVCISCFPCFGKDNKNRFHSPSPKRQRRRLKTSKKSKHNIKLVVMWRSYLPPIHVYGTEFWRRGNRNDDL